MDSIRYVIRRRSPNVYDPDDMSRISSRWKTLQHKSANASSEEGRVEPSCRRLQLRDKICLTMSHAQVEVPRGKVIKQKAIELVVFIEFISRTCMCRNLLCPSK